MGYSLEILPVVYTGNIFKCKNEFIRPYNLKSPSKDRIENK